MYRTAPQPGAADVSVACRACAARRSIRLDNAATETFTCKHCNVEQPALRGADDLGVERVALVDWAEAKNYDELSALLASFGVAGKALSLTLECDGVRMIVSLSLNSGVVQGIDIVADAPGIAEINFVRETEAHAEAKSKGVAREVQTGDSTFDPQVYIESPLRDVDVHAVLSAPAVRRAVRELVGIGDRAQLRDDRVRVSIPKDREAFEPEKIRERLAWVRVLAGAPLPLAAEHAPVSGAASVAQIATYALMPLAAFSAFIGINTYGPVSNGPYAIGGLSGLVLAFLSQPLFVRALRGRSTSHRDVLIARVATTIWLPVLATGLLCIVNGAFDRSSERPVTLEVVSSSLDDDDKEVIHVVARDDAGTTHRYKFTAKAPTTSAVVTTSWRTGALGWPWESGHAALSQAKR